MLPQVIARGILHVFHIQEQQLSNGYNVGLNVVEVAHNFQQQIRRYVVEELKLLNSYDTWHGKVHVHMSLSLVFYMCMYAGTKNVAKSLAEVIKGKKGNPVKDQLCDKC